MKSHFYLKAFLTFFKIGLFTIGGGYAMIPLIEKDVVDKYRWVDREEFLDMMALSQAMPGVFAVNFSICIGNRLRGLMFFRAFSDNVFVEAFFKGIRPAVVALIAVPCFKLGRAAKITIHNLWLPLVVALLISLMGISPVYIIVMVAAGAYVYGRYFKED